jgi:hypothetical protein
MYQIETPFYLKSAHMKQVLPLLLLLVSIQAIAQKNEHTKSVLDLCINHAESASLYRNSVNWDSLRSQVYALAEDADSIPDLFPAMSHLFEALRDEHGRILYNWQSVVYYFGEPKPHQNGFDPAIYSKVQSGQVYAFHTELLQKNVGYVRIVGMPTGDNVQMAKGIQDAVCELVDKGAQKWIIDLRYNGGGNLMPMAEGIAPIIGNGHVGGSEGLTQQESSDWKIENDDFYYDEYHVELEEGCPMKKLPKVAILTSLYTASSGEALAVMFKGRKRTRFFGHKTIGLVTVTDYTELDEATKMILTVSYYKDRNGTVYKEYVDVDEELPFVAEPLSEGDTSVQRALEWLGRGK